MALKSLYLRIAAGLNLAFIGALLWDNQASGTWFGVISILFFAHLVAQAVVLFIGGKSDAPESTNYPVYDDAPRVRQARPNTAQPGPRTGVALPPSPPAARPVAPGAPVVVPIPKAGPSASAAKAPHPPAPASSTTQGKPVFGHAPEQVAADAPIQCLAIRADHRQCTDARKARSKYCVAHQGHRPSLTTQQPSAEIPKGPAPAKAQQAKPTGPAHVDGKPSVKAHRPAKAVKAAKPAKVVAPKPTKASRKQAKPILPVSQGKCQAITASDKPCANRSKPDGAYCGKHRNYAPNVASKRARRAKPKQAS